MNIVVGTKNKSKIATVSRVMTEFFPQAELIVTGIDVPSGVPDTPRDEETKQGAYNRAQTIYKHQPGYAIGIESGLVKRYGIWFEEAWACIIVDDTPYYGYSSGLTIPTYVLKIMNENDLEHGPHTHQVTTSRRTRYMGYLLR